MPLDRKFPRCAATGSGRPPARAHTHTYIRRTERLKYLRASCLRARSLARRTTPTTSTKRRQWTSFWNGRPSTTARPPATPPKSWRRWTGNIFTTLGRKITCGADRPGQTRHVVTVTSLYDKCLPEPASAAKSRAAAVSAPPPHRAAHVRGRPQLLTFRVETGKALHRGHTFAKNGNDSVKKRRSVDLDHRALRLLVYTDPVVRRR